jgi:two-component system nitrate/nitrite response regulator NarL
MPPGSSRRLSSVAAETDQVTGTMTQVFILTSEPLFGLGLKQVLCSPNGFNITHICANVSDLIENLESVNPEVLLFDWNAEVLLKELPALRSSLPALRTVLCVRAISTELAFQLIGLGVHGILSKTASPEMLLKCMQIAAKGGLWLEDSLRDQVLGASSVNLTKRESQLVNMLARGWKNKEIALRLGLTEGTVKVYLTRLFQKVGVTGRFELALYGLKNMTEMDDLSDFGLKSARSGQKQSLKDSHWPGSLVIEKRSKRAGIAATQSN